MYNLEKMEPEGGVALVEQSSGKQNVLGSTPALI